MSKIDEFYQRVSGGRAQQVSGLRRAVAATAAQAGVRCQVSARAGGLQRFWQPASRF